MLKVAFRATLLAAIAFSLTAQEYRGRVQGAVTDTTQAAIAGATVTLANIQTGVTNTRQTNEQGRYLFDLVMPGTYTVTVQYQGFQKYVQEQVFLQARSDVTVDALSPNGSDVLHTQTFSIILGPRQIWNP